MVFKCTISFIRDGVTSKVNIKTDQFDPVLLNLDKIRKLSQKFLVVI
jgi:hypothetical protein